MQPFDDPASRPRPPHEPPLTPADAFILLDALVGYGASLTAHEHVRLPSLVAFVK